MAGILKYFYEEPFLLEPLVADDHPDARRRYVRTTPLEVYRAYLAGSSPSGIGLTTLNPPSVYTHPLHHLFDGQPIHVLDASGMLQLCLPDALDTYLIGKQPCHALIAGPATLPPVNRADLMQSNRRHALHALRTLLEAGALVAWPEPAHQGIDWSLYSPAPLRTRLVAAFRRFRHPDVRYFVAPYQRMRSEEKFYFEHWMLDHHPLPTYIEEV